MARPKKKNSNPQQSMEELLANTVALYGIPYDDRDGERDSELPSLHTVADQLGTTVLRVRKLLITAEYFSTAVSRQVQQMVAGNQDLIKTVLNLLTIINVSRRNIRKSDDRVHGRSNIMRHVGQKSVLGVVRMSRLFQRVFEQSAYPKVLLPLLIDICKPEQHLH